MKTERLRAGDPCLAKLPGLRSPWFKATVIEALPKGYKVKRLDASDLDEPLRVKESCCRRTTAPRRAPIRFPKEWGVATFNGTPIPPFDPAALTRPKPKVDPSVEPAPIEFKCTLKEAPAWRSEAYKALVRTQPCCNCGKPPPSDPDHNGKHGIARKASDSSCVPLCRKCHRIKTGIPGHIGGCLPDPRDSERKGKTVLRSREETADIIAKEQVRLLTLVLERLPLDKRVEALARGVEGVSEEVLRANHV